MNSANQGTEDVLLMRSQRQNDREIPVLHSVFKEFFETVKKI